MQNLAEKIASRFGAKIETSLIDRNELTIEIAPADLIEVCTALRDEADFAFEQMIDLCGVDYAGYGDDEWDGDSAPETGFSRGVEAGAGDRVCRFQPKSRFAVVYHLLSVTHNRRLRLRIFPEGEAMPKVETVTNVWSAANWFEREAFDLYGILFEGHPDLRRILTDYGFVGHPFRKDFPLSGHVEMRYDPEKRRVVYEPVSIDPRTLVPKTIRDDNRYGGEEVAE